MVVFCEVGFFVELIWLLVDMISFKFVEEVGDDVVISDIEEEVIFSVDESGVVRRKEKMQGGVDVDMFLDYGFVQILGGIVVLWLLCVIVLYDGLSKFVIMDVSVIEVVMEKFVIFVLNVCEVRIDVFFVEVYMLNEGGM